MAYSSSSCVSCFLCCLWLSITYQISEGFTTSYAQSRVTSNNGGIPFVVNKLRRTNNNYHHDHDMNGRRHFWNLLMMEESVEAAPEVTSSGRDGKEGFRRVQRMEKFARLPVWPAWNGVFIFLISKLLGETVAAKVEDQIGGRVCPNFFSNPQTTSPFLMLVHHRHSFAGWDILRLFQSKFILPEGFPAHPHRGFITVTYCLKGGMKHRDSMGIQQSYGSAKHHKQQHTQWLFTGSGLLHEEMWDIPSNQNIWDNSHQELYQLWLNVPVEDKMKPPQVHLLGGDDDDNNNNNTPTVVERSTTTLIIYGQHKDQTACCSTTNHNNEEEDNLLSKYQKDVNIFHVQMDPKSTWEHIIPTTSNRHDTVILYVRRGSIQIGEDVIPTHYTAYLSNDVTAQNIQVISHEEGADFLFLSGVNLREPVEAQGSMVMTTPNEINEAYADYQMGKMGIPWSEKLSDDEWNTHIQKSKRTMITTTYANQPTTTNNR